MTALAPTPLGIYANSVTPPSEGPDPRCAARRVRERLRQVASTLVPGSQAVTADGEARTKPHRVARCGRHMVGAQVSLVRSPQGARFLGVETCGSVWLCPVCAAKIAEGRRADIEACLDAHVAGRRLVRLDGQSGDIRDWQPGMERPEVMSQAEPGAVFMATFTMRHHAGQSCAALRDVVAEAWRRMARGAPWDRAKAKFRVEGMIRAMEITHGDNGWHPHLHVLILAGDLSDDEEEALRLFLVERWLRIVERLGGEASASHGFHLLRAKAVSDAGDYVAKWGCDSEIAKWHVKKGRGDNRSPWGLLAAAGEGDRAAALRWREYAHAFTGKRHITWTHGLRDLYLTTPEPTDEDLSVDEWCDPMEGELVVGDRSAAGQVVVGRFRRGVWLRLVKAGVLAEVLEAAESEGWPGVLDLLALRRLALRRE